MAQRSGKAAKSAACAPLVLVIALAVLGPPGRAWAASVGYYEMCSGQGNANQATPISAAGHTPVQLFDLAAADLAGVDVAFVTNCNNGAYGAEYLSRLADIQAAVSGGLVLVLHDRYVDAAETILPGGGSFDILRDFADATDIDVRDASTLVTNGPGGVVNDGTLDGGNFSSHGFAIAGSLPGTAALILSTSDPDHVVTFAYEFGAGAVVYSSIPLDFYLGGSSNFSSVYAPNVVAYGASLVNACGDGNLDGGEDCDPGADVPGDCCSAACQFQAPGTPCNEDGDLCSVDQCDAAGTCTFASSVSCQAANPPCEGGELCNPTTGACDPQPDPNGTPCDADANLCTNDQCDGSGFCVLLSNVTCQAANPPCEGGETCNPGTGACDAQPDAGVGTSCEADANLCTNDECDGAGSCVFGSNVVCAALDQCHEPGTCAPATGICSNPTKPDGFACLDGDECTQSDMCVGGVCIGNPVGADTDADGYCDAWESKVGCNPDDFAETPPQGLASPGTPGPAPGQGLMAFAAPTDRRVYRAVDASCATAGVCGPTGFCLAGKLGDPCIADGDCDGASNTCRVVVNYANVSGFTLEAATLNRSPIAGFTPATPGCARKVDVALDPTRAANRLLLKATGTVHGRPRRERDRLIFKQ